MEEKQQKSEISIIDPAEFGLEKEKTSKIDSSFLPKISERDGLAKVYELILTKEITKEVSSLDIMSKFAAFKKWANEQIETI